MLDYFTWDVTWPEENLQIGVFGSTATVGGSGGSQVMTPGEMFALIETALDGGATYARFRQRGPGLYRPDRALRVQLFDGATPLEIDLAAASANWKAALGFDGPGQVLSGTLLQADRSFIGAWAPLDWCLIRSENDPIKHLSMSQPQEGPPVVVPRRSRLRHSPVYRYVPGALVYPDRHRYPQLPLDAQMAPGDLNGCFTNLWEFLSQGGQAIYIPEVDQPASGALVPQAAEYTHFEVYNMSPGFARDPMSVMSNTHGESASDGYHINLELNSDA